MPKFQTPIIFQDATSQATAGGGGSADLTPVWDELGANPSGSFTTVEARLNARLTCRKTADQTFSATTTVANVADMLLPVNTTAVDYMFRFVIAYSSTSTSNGIRLAVTWPSSSFGSAKVSIAGRAAVTAGTQGSATSNLGAYEAYITTSGTAVASDAVAAANAIYIATIDGILSAPTATGSIQLQAANEVSTSNGNVIRRGSWGEVYIA